MLEPGVLAARAAASSPSPGATSWGAKRGGANADGVVNTGCAGAARGCRPPRAGRGPRRSFSTRFNRPDRLDQAPAGGWIGAVDVADRAHQPPPVLGRERRHEGPVRGDTLEQFRRRLELFGQLGDVTIVEGWRARVP
jgi:hypothetical protein